MNLFKKNTIKDNIQLFFGIIIFVLAVALLVYTMFDLAYSPVDLHSYSLIFIQ